jgi:GntR family transcriptional regulator
MNRQDTTANGDPPRRNLATRSLRGRHVHGPLVAADADHEVLDPFGFKVDPHSGVPIYRQIVNQVLYLAALGVLDSDDPLPSIRGVALGLKIAPNTVSRAYEELEAVGVVHKRRGLGTYISTVRGQTIDGERRHVLEERVDALWDEAHYLNIAPEAILELVRLRAPRSTADSTKVPQPQESEAAPEAFRIVIGSPRSTSS